MGATGDFIDDTRQEGSSTQGCPAAARGEKKCSCVDGVGGGGGAGVGNWGLVVVGPGGERGKGGSDPVGNFMDYSSDVW